CCLRHSSACLRDAASIAPTTAVASAIVSAESAIVRHKIQKDEFRISMYSIVVPRGDRVNDEDKHRKSGIGGWLLVLCLLLVVGQPVNLAIGAARMLGALPIRVLPLGPVVLCQLIVTGI